MTSDTHTLLVECLRAMAKRPALFIGNNDPERAELWLNGFAAAIDIQWLGDEHRQIREEIWKGHGWEIRSTSTWRQMIERKMTPEEIVSEMVAVEIEFLDKISSTLATQS